MRATDEQLRCVWARLQPTQQGWPASYEDTMADPVRCRLVHIAAARAAQGFPVPVERTGNRRPAVIDPGLTRPALPEFRYRPAPIDRKRAAAGERDDD